MTTFYSINVRRKTGEWQNELSMRKGIPPKQGDVIEAHIHGEVVKARVTNTAANPSKARDEPAMNVYAEQI
jgi:hypothetical protein